MGSERRCESGSRWGFRDDTGVRRTPWGVGRHGADARRTMKHFHTKSTIGRDPLGWQCLEAIEDSAVLSPWPARPKGARGDE